MRSGMAALSVNLARYAAQKPTRTIMIIPSHSKSHGCALSITECNIGKYELTDSRGLRRWLLHASLSTLMTKHSSNCRRLEALA